MMMKMTKKVNNLLTVVIRIVVMKIQKIKAIVMKINARKNKNVLIKTKTKLKSLQMLQSNMDIAKKYKNQTEIKLSLVKQSIITDSREIYLKMEVIQIKVMTTLIKKRNCIKMIIKNNSTETTQINDKLKKKKIVTKMTKRKCISLKERVKEVL